jgi:uncharacterized protein (TIGR00269 family)
MESGTGVRETPCCTVCGESAVFFERRTRRHFCSTHFTGGVEHRVAETITGRRMIVQGDTVAVALSGGKDSTALLMILSRVLPAIADVPLVAITVDEGIRGYRGDTIRSADRIARELGMEHRTISFAEVFGDTLDAILAGRETRSCSICGILRKKALADGARAAGATKLATGHNLDDEAQSVLMNVLRGDLPRLARDSSADTSGRFIPRIKPLMFVSEKEIATYLVLRGAWPELPECPYARHALRREARSMLSTLEYRHPGTMLRLMESRQKIGDACAGGAIPDDPLLACRQCGDPCSGELCRFCHLKLELGRELSGNRR